MRVYMSACVCTDAQKKVLLRVVSDPEVETLYHAVFLRWALPRCSCPTPFADVCDIQHVPCVWHSFVVRVETLAFIRNKNKYKSPVILYHAVSLLLDIRKNTSARRHVGRRPSWSTCHARRTPRESHPGCCAAVITNEPSNHRPNLLPTMKLLGRRNHHDFVEFRLLKKTTVPAVLLATVVTPAEASFGS